MTIFRLLILASAFCLSLSSLADTDVEISIQADAPGAIIDRHIYGQFAEHLGHGIYQGLWVGEDSRIPNIRGFRRDVVEALQALQIPNIRWPGGCFAEEYHWKDGIGPRDERPTRINTNWGDVEESNAVGTHEFFDLAEMLGADAYIVGNVGRGSPKEMAEWLEYITADNNSALAKLRRANGREAPWNVPFWGVGNENWKCGGNMRAEYYADVYRRYTTFLKAPSNNTPKKIASGGYHLDTAWTDEISQIGSKIDGIGIHYYTMVTENWVDKGNATGFTKDEWFAHLAETLKMDDYLRSHIAVLDRNDPEGRIGVYVDEWGSWYDVEEGSNRNFLRQQNSIRDALVAAINFNIFHRYADRIRMTNIAQMVNVLQAMILTDGGEMLLTPTYHVYEMHTPFHDAVSVPVESGGVPSVSDGDTSIPMVSASAAIGKGGDLAISLVNLSPETDVSLAARVDGFVARDVSGKVLTGEEIDAHNTFATPNAVRPMPIRVSIEDDYLRLTLPAKSVVVLSVQRSSGQ